jgi:ATP-dependent DNA helicase RecQ
VREEIVERLALRDPVVLVRGFDRPNIDLAVERFHGEQGAERKLRALQDAIAGAPKPGIVYVATRRQAEELAASLCEAGVTAASYHGGMRGPERDAVQERFMDSGLEVVVATTAFGMGIDKADVRFVLHAQVADSLDSYYQEVGRAGRDGEPATAVLFYREQDVGLRRFFASGLPKEQDLQRIATLVSLHEGAVEVTDLKAASGFGPTKLASLVSLLEQVGALQPAEGERLDLGPDIVDPVRAAEAAGQAAVDRQRLSRSRVDMMRGYADTQGCRRQYLLAYFGEAYEPPCGRCDACHAGRVEASRTPTTSSFPANSQVVHAEWGEGVVMSSDGDQLTVLFESVGYKTLLEAAVADNGLLRATG